MPPIEPQEGPPLDVLGRLVVRSLRDGAFEQFEWLLTHPNWQHNPLAVKLRALAPDQQDAVRQAVLGALDTAIHDFLFGLIEQHDFGGRIALTVDGVNAVTLSDGLHGESYSEDGWNARFSRHGERPA